MRPREEGTAAVAADDRPDAPLSDAVTAPAVLPTFSPSKPAAPGSRVAAPNALDRATNAPPDFDAVFAEVLTSDLFDEALTTLTRPTANSPEAQPFAIESPDTAPNKGGGGASGHDAAGGGGGGNGGASSPQHGHTAADGNSAVAASSGAHSTATEAGGEPVSPRNGSPVARGDEYRLWTGVGTSVSGNVGDNDDAPSGSTFSLMSHPDHGEVQFNSDGSFIYTLQTSWHGEEDLFSYRLWSGGVYAQASVRIDLLDNTPLAMDDEYKGAIAGAEFTVSAAEGVLINDIEYDNEPLSDATLVAGPANGSVALNSDGSFSYTADDDFFGWDSFTYICSDGKNFGESATVSIGVNDLIVYHDGYPATVLPSETVVGKKVTLSLEWRGPGFDAPVSLRDVQWTIPGADGDPLTDTAIRNYEVSQSQGVVTPLEATAEYGDDLDDPTVRFYWIDGIELATVSATATVRVGTAGDHKDYATDAEGRVAVLEPTPQTITYDYGPITYPQGAEPDGVATLLLGDPTTIPATQGITITANATAPSGYAGSLGFIQLVTSVRSYRNSANLLFRFNSSDWTATGYAYDNIPGKTTVLYGDKVVALPAGQSAAQDLKVVDSPDQPIASDSMYVGVHDDFSDFLMYKPGAINDPNTIWVTIRKFKWGWEADASNTGTAQNPNWQAGVGETLTDPSLQGPSTQLPQWDVRIQNIATEGNYIFVPG